MSDAVDNVGAATFSQAPTQDDLREKALQLLEFPAVRQRLAAHTAFAASREAALALTPSGNSEEAARRQRETTEARQLIAVGRAPDLSLAKDIRPPVERAAKGGLLAGEDLLAVQATLKAARAARSAVSQHRADLPLLAALVAQMAELRDLETAIARSISADGQVEDRASPNLGQLRAEARTAYGRLVDALERLCRSSLGQRVLQEPIVTERSGRLVVPVKVEMRSRLPGLVHDVSDSGATLFVEPLAVVSQGNRWRELRLAEAREVERVLRDLSASVGEHAQELLVLMALLTRLDLALAKARYADALAAVPAATGEGDRPYLRLVAARHPLLKEPVVPISLSLGQPQAPPGDKPTGDGWNVLLITGPNAGGKTVSLKTVGLLALMHAAGLHVPAAEGTVLPVLDGIFADIGDQQSIERSLSTFSSHISSIRAILAQATPRSLVLLDELGTSTDPEEGSALAKAILFHFLGLGIPLITTTHHREVAAFVQETPGMVNASVELDPVTLAPTYRLTLGLPGRSYALAIASRLGMPAEVVERARSMLQPVHAQLERLLAEVQSERASAQEKRREAEEALARAEATRCELEAQLEELQARRSEEVVATRQELQARVDDLLERLRDAEGALASAQVAPAVKAAPLRQAITKVRALKRELQSPAWQPKLPSRAEWLDHLQSGDMVKVRGFPTPAQVLSPPDSNGSAEVLVGGMRLRVSVDQIERPLPTTGAAAAEVKGVSAAAQAVAYAQTSLLARDTERGPTNELDLRGVRVEDGLRRLEAFLDRSVLRGLTSVRIIHGMGTGAMRMAIRERLGSHPLVKSWAPDDARRGDGATLVQLA